MQLSGAGVRGVIVDRALRACAALQYNGHRERERKREGQPSSSSLSCGNLKAPALETYLPVLFCVLQREERGVCVWERERARERDGGNCVNLNWIGIRCRMRERTYHV